VCRAPLDEKVADRRGAPAERCGLRPLRRRRKSWHAGLRCYRRRRSHDQDRRSPYAHTTRRGRPPRRNPVFRTNSHQPSLQPGARAPRRARRVAASPATRRVHLTMLRSLLTQLGRDGGGRRRAGAIPSRRPPETLSAVEYGDRIRAPDRRTVIGKRDYALLSLMGARGVAQHRAHAG
jgi:hypothetical protein